MITSPHDGEALSACRMLAKALNRHGLRVGEVDRQGRPGTLGPRPRMSPIVRPHRRASAADVSSLLGYVERNAEPLAPHHCHAVVAALRDALRDAVDRDDSRR